MPQPTPEEHAELMRQLHVPHRLVDPDGAAPTRGSMSTANGGGELRGVRQTMDELRANGESEAAVQRIARQYDQDVQACREPAPLRRD